VAKICSFLFPRKSCAFIIFDKSELGNILGHFFTNSSGRPAQKSDLGPG
jgi:hypothetical protein